MRFGPDGESGLFLFGGDIDKTSLFVDNIICLNVIVAAVVRRISDQEAEKKRAVYRTGKKQ